LKLFIPETTLSNDELIRFYEELTSKISANKNISLVIDPKETIATHTLFFNGEWNIGYPNGSIKNAGKNIDEIVKNLMSINTKASLLINLPLTNTVAKTIKNNWKENNSVQLGKSASNSTYILLGRIVNNNLEYAFIIPKLNKNDVKYLSALPVRTDFINAKKENELSDTLTELSYKLGKIQAWLTMTGPQSGQSNFPFVLAVKKIKSKLSTITDFFTKPTIL
jgi:hypothetical protein